MNCIGEASRDGRALGWATAMLCTALTALSLTACDSSETIVEPPDEPEEPPVVDIVIEEDSILLHLNALADDSMMGRGAGTIYERQAAQYIRARFIEYGLADGAADYFQIFTSGVDTSQNVIGVVPGQGRLAGQWIVMGAHYDAVGFTWITPDSVEVNNGADDNASGTALIVELARGWAARAAAHADYEVERRSLMFHAYGAEERGLIGSKHFCSHPLVPMDSVVAMLNFDMVGRLQQRGALEVRGVSSSEDWGSLLQAANDGALPLEYPEGALNRSDQYCFYQAEKPVLMFHTGGHDDYHTPSDDVHLIDTAGMVEIGDLSAAVLDSLVVDPEPPLFTPVVFANR